jgi:hypothetical protein
MSNLNEARQMKICSRCEVSKRITEFCHNRRSIDSYNSTCHHCKEKLRIYKKIHYQENKEHYQASNKSNYLKNKPRRSQLSRESKTRSLENFIKYLYSGIKARFKISRSLKCEISIQDIIDLHHNQKGLCAITLVKMTHALNSPDAISIDRINSDHDYINGNVQLVCQFINLGKRNHTNNEIKEFIRKIRDVDNVKTY